MLISLKDVIKNVMDDVASKREKWIKYVPATELSSIIKQYEDAFRIILIKLETQIFVNELESLKKEKEIMKSKEILEQIKAKYRNLTDEMTNLSIHELLLLQMENDKTIGSYDLESIINKLIEKLLKEKMCADKKEESDIDFMSSIANELVIINERASEILYYENYQLVFIKKNAKTIRQIGKALLDKLQQYRLGQLMQYEDKDKKEKTIGLYDLEAKTLQELLQEDIVENCIDDLDAILSSISILKDAHYTYAHHERWKLVTLTLENVIRKLKQEKE